MNENKQKLIRVILWASIALVQTCDMGLSEEAIRGRIVRIVDNLVDAVEKV
jgi:hypothetical protein